jgi:menaquinone-dependent protoporphyrinogen oxidase
MKVLVVVASRHGATAEIAHSIAATLEARGFEAPVVEASLDPDLEDVEALVLGSAIYMGGWLDEARAFAAAHVHELALMPVWLFSSGPLGDPPVPAETPELPEELRALRIQGHEVFGGRLAKHDLHLSERIVTHMVQAPTGDFRRWSDVSAWASQVADALRAMEPVHPAAVHHESSSS